MDAAIKEKYQPVIGLEVHAQLKVKSKIYSSDDTTFGAPPNSQVSVITLAHPGTLPKLNRLVVEEAIKMGLACNSEISRYQVFDRKNYFYPDLPKGYQLTQDRTPICRGGYIAITTQDGSTNIKLNRIHIEEDAGKSIHDEVGEDTLVDLNRAGVPLIEIVTEPVIKSSEEAGALLTEIRKLVRYLEVCDGNMEEGSLRCDANVSVMRKGETRLGKKVEVKNMNSIRNVQRAIDFEIERQIELIEAGHVVTSETRTFDVVSGTTSGMRTKEELNDYRYFPDPDLSPLVVSEEWLESIKKSMPALPGAVMKRLVNDFSLSDYDAGVISESKDLAEYFFTTCQAIRNYKAVSNWLMGPIKSYLNETGNGIEVLKVKPSQLAELIELVDGLKVSYTTAAQTIFPLMLEGDERSARQIADDLDLLQNSDEDAIHKLVDEVLQANPGKVVEYRKGKKGLISMFVGEVMKKSGGKADPKLTNNVLQKKLNER